MKYMQPCHQEKKEIQLSVSWLVFPGSERNQSSGVSSPFSSPLPCPFPLTTYISVRDGQVDGPQSALLGGGMESVVGGKS